MRLASSTFAPLALLIAAGAHPADKRAAADRPDVVLFIIDDVAESDVESVPTPVMDLLGATGVRFRRAYAHAKCAQTRDSIYRGVWVGRQHGQTCYSSPGPLSLDHGALTLAKVMDTAGYETALFGKWHQGVATVTPWESSPHVYGWETVAACVPDNIGICISGSGAMGTGHYRRWVSVDNGKSRTSSVYQTIALRDAFLDWWQEDRGPDPRFAVVSFQACHSPFHRPPDEILPSWYEPGSDDRGKFEAMLVSVDHVIGEILPLLTPETWIIIVGDNGTPRNAVRANQDSSKVKRTTFEDGVRVPMIVHAPGVRQGLEVHDVVHVVDIMPTLADVLGLCLPATVDGVSFLRTLKGGRARRDWVYCHNYVQQDRAVITRRWKLRDLAGVQAVFDLENDPSEENPLDPDDPGLRRVVEPLRSVLAEIQQTY